MLILLEIIYAYLVGCHRRSGKLGNARRLEGTIKAVRVYSRVLTEDELRWNRLVDEQRFFGDPGTVFFLR